MKTELQEAPPAAATVKTGKIVAVLQPGGYMDLYFDDGNGRMKLIQPSIPADSVVVKFGE